MASAMLSRGPPPRQTLSRCNIRVAIAVWQQCSVNEYYDRALHRKEQPRFSKRGFWIGARSKGLGHGRGDRTDDGIGRARSRQI